MNKAQAYADFLRYVEKWADNLCNMIKQMKSKGVKPMLIALSRKMPRFIDWVLKSGNLPRHSVDTIRNTELTTELALPFLFFQSDSDEERGYIVIDDIIIHGTTIKNVVKDIVLIAGDNCHLSCIFRRESVELIPYIGLFELVRIPAVTDEEAEIYIDIISGIVENTQLPIDMEFPIFKQSAHDGISFERLEKELPEIGFPIYKIGNSGDRFSMDLPDPSVIGRNNDFSKFRFFKKKNDTIIEVIAPHLISNHQLLSTSIDERLFEDNPYYQAIWDKCSLKIRRSLNKPKEGFEGDWENMKSNFTRSLCVFANYLFSLSVFAAYKKMIFSVAMRNPFRDAVLSRRDLTLLIGVELTNTIYSFLEAMIFNLDIVKTNMDSVLTLPNKFSPEAYRSDWERNTVIACLVSDIASDALKAIFSYQHYSNPKFKNPYLNKERLFFGESYDSLISKISSYFPRIDAAVYVNQWIDENIDGGYVVPKYERVMDADGVMYWRRYFHSGVRSYSA